MGSGTDIPFRREHDEGGCGMNYKKLIIELLDKIDNGKFLRRIYVSLREYARENERLDGETAETMV